MVTGNKGREDVRYGVRKLRSFLFLLIDKHIPTLKKKGRDREEKSKAELFLLSFL